MKVVLPPASGKATSAALLSRLFALGLTLLLAACASEPAKLPVASVVTTAEEECRSEPVPDSSFTRRTCRTAEEWAVIDGKREPVPPTLKR